MTIQVIIIGGGVAGLTLALALEHSPVPIKYVLLERRDTLTPQVGASIGLAPNGSRILDQLGVYETLSTLLFPISSEGVHDETGQCLAGARTEMFKLIPKRTGYPVAFLERRELLRVLWEAIRQRAAVLTGKKVVSIEQGKENAVVVCADGTRYTGDIVVGADGVHSTARTAMWQQNAEADEDDRLTAEYKCLFGIADPVRGLDAGSYDVTQAVDVSTLVITGKGDQVYWFLFGRMPCVYRGAAQIPRFTTEDAEKFVGEHLHLPIRPQGSITLAHIWKATKQATLTALEEADFQHWAGNRIVCIGDSAHKMTPNSGAGGMLAIESAAALANAIWELASNSRAATQPEITEITDALRAFETDMHARATSTIRAAAEVTRLQALRSFKERILARFVLPYAGDTPVNIACDSWVGARCIKYLPPPPRSLRGHTPFNPAQGIEHEPPLDWKRVCLALPLVACAFTPATTTAISTSLTPTTASASTLTIWYAVALIESARRANAFNVLRFAVIWAVLVLYNPPRLLPVYYLLHYLCSPVGVFKSADMRTTDLVYTRGVLPITFCLFGLFTFISGLGTDMETEPPFLPFLPFLPFFLPVIVAVAQRFLAQSAFGPSTIQQDRLDNVRCDVRAIQRTVGTLCVLAVAARLYALWLGEDEIGIGLGIEPGSLATAVWVGLSIWDVKAAGIVKTSWGVLGAWSVGAFLLGGEAALLGGAWLVREYGLATGRHLEALVEGS